MSVAAPQLSAELSELCSQLLSAVEVMMSPTAPRQDRMEAFNRCEQFKATSPAAVQCGLALAHPSRPPVARHFGLKLLEDAIKLRWNNMEPEQKLFLKESVMKMIGEGAADLMTEAAHIKDGISRYSQ